MIDLMEVSRNMQIEDNVDKSIICEWNRKATREEVVSGKYELNENVRVVYNFTTGEILNEIDDDIIIHKLSSKKLFSVYYKYHEDIEMISVTLFYANIFAPTYANEKRSWIQCSTYFIDKNKNLYIKDDNLAVPKYINNKESHAYIHIFNAMKYNGIDCRLSKNNKNYNENYYNVVKRLFGEYIKTKMLDIVPTTKIDSLSYIMKNVDFDKKQSKKQSIIDELIQKPLPKLKAQHKKRTDRYMVINKVDDNTCCVRAYKDYVSDQYSDCIELWRLYLIKDKEYVCTKNNKGEYVLLNLNMNNEIFNYVLLPIKKNDLEGTKFQYLYNSLEEFDNENKSLVLWTFIKNPIVEKFYNAGYSNIVKYSIEEMNTSGSCLKTIERIFGKIIKAKSLNSSLGVNKNQLRKIKEKDDLNYYVDTSVYDYRKRKNPGLLNIIKSISDLSNLNSLDENTFDRIIDIALKLLDKLKVNNEYSIRNKIYQIIQYLGETSKMFSVKTMIDISDNLLYVCFEEDGDSFFYESPISIYADYLIMVKQLDRSQYCKPSFNNVEDLINMHNSVLSLYQILQSSKKKDDFKKVSGKWKKYEYENDKYMIVAPEEPEELAIEGITLHHCVKSYIDRVIANTTNILFLRKVKEPEIPFFTIEITNDNVIQQVHGSCNRNTNTEPGIDEFIGEWVENCNLQTSNYNKVR